MRAKSAVFENMFSFELGQAITMLAWGKQTVSVMDPMVTSGVHVREAQ